MGSPPYPRFNPPPIQVLGIHHPIFLKLKGIGGDALGPFAGQVGSVSAKSMPLRIGSATSPISFISTSLVLISLTSIVELSYYFFEGHHFYRTINPVVLPTDNQITLSRVMFMQPEG
jgi:hypothetical protein